MEHETLAAAGGAETWAEEAPAKPSAVLRAAGTALLVLCAPFAVGGVALSTFGWAIGIWWAVSNDAGFVGGVLAIFVAEAAGFLAIGAMTGLTSGAQACFERAGR